MMAFKAWLTVVFVTCCNHSALIKLLMRGKEKREKREGEDKGGEERRGGEEKKRRTREGVGDRED